MPQRLPDWPNRSSGFTLLEIALCIVIVGVGITAAMVTVTTSSRQNDHALKLTTATLLAANIQEYTVRLPVYDPVLGARVFGPSDPKEKAVPADALAFDDLSAFKDEIAFNPPINGSGVPDPTRAEYTQYVQVVPIDPDSVTTALTIPPSPPGGYYRFRAVQVQVRIVHQYPGGEARELFRSQWVRTTD